MGKIAFVFSGQGAQYTGMGRELYNISPAAKAVFDMADALRPGTSKQCFEGTKEELSQTINTQPCMLAMSLSCAKALEEAGVKADGAAGFSLGEITALGFCGVLSPGEAFELVVRRAEIMEACAARNPGGMAAVLKLSSDEVEGLCSLFSNIFPVNYNCPGQTVVAGAADELDSFIQAVKEKGGRAIKLAVSGAFHSPFMSEASKGLSEALKAYTLKPPAIPLYANLTALPYGENAAELTAKQVSNPVLWEKTVRNMIKDGFDTFIELGPKTVLRDLTVKISGDVKALNVEDKASLEQALFLLA